MFNFGTLMTLVESLVTLEPTIAAEIKTLLANPAVIQLEGLLAGLLHVGTVTTATGSAAVVTPK